MARRIYSMRGTDAREVIETRLKAAAREISHWNEYDYVLVNRDIEDSLSALKAIVQAERHRRCRQPGLSEFAVGLFRRRPKSP